MATATITTEPIGSQLTSIIGSNEDDDKNDFSVFISWDENVTGFAQADCAVNNSASIQSFEGENSVYKAVVRPSTSAAVVTFTISADAVNEGNSETTQDIRVSTSFPDTDAQTPTQLFTVNDSAVEGIAVSSTRVYVSDDVTILPHTFSGTHQTSENATIPSGVNRLDYINGDIIAGTRRRSLETGDEIFNTLLPRSLVHTRLGYLSAPTTTEASLMPYDGSVSGDIQDVETDNIPSPAPEVITHQNDLLYLMKTGSSGEFGLARITESDTVEYITDLNIKNGSTGLNFSRIQDIDVYRDTLYILEDVGSTGTVYTLDIRPYRPMALNTKTLIPPVIVTGDTTIDCTQYAPDANTIIFDVGFDLPDYLSISSNTITVDTSALTGVTTCFIRLKGINYVDATETGVFGFYLIIIPETAPVWNSVTELAMRADSTYNLNLLVDADSIAFRSGITQPTGSSLSDGVFTIGTTSGTAQFTATKNSLETHKSIEIDVIQDATNLRGTRTRYKVEIASIDVSADLLNAPTVSEHLDPIAINETRINEATIALKGTRKYDQNRADNFWDTNSLNAGGFQESVKIYTEHLISGTWTENLLFSGIILESSYPVESAEFRLNCVDASHILQNIVPRDLGTLEKWAETRQTTDEDTFEGPYSPPNSLLPIQPATGKAWTDRTALTLADLQNQSEGVVPANTGYLTTQDFRTAGGFVPTNPILNYKTLPISAEIELLMKALSVGENHAYNIEIDLTGKTVDMPYVLNRGNIPRNIQDIANTLIVTDWVYDSTDNRILMLLSNPEQHLDDLIVQYSLSENAYRVLHTFSKSIKAYRIERRDSTNYYILTSPPITQNRSASTTPRPIDRTAYAYDSIAAGSVIRIHHYNASTNTLTEHVPEDDDRPPQLGIQYYVGFENDYQIDEYEGIRPEYRGAFKWYDNNLYYRYATDAEYGVARVNATGTTSEMIDQARGGDWEHLNFAFDVDASGNIYFGYHADGTLTLKQLTSGGTESTIWTGDASDGVYRGVHELLFHSDNVYMVVPIQQYQEGTTDVSKRLTAKAILCRVNTTGTAELTTLKSYDYVHQSACNLIVYDGEVYFTEFPPASEQYQNSEGG